MPGYALGPSFPAITQPILVGFEKKVISLSNSAILFYVRQGKRNEFLEPKIWVWGDDDDDDENYMKSI